MIIGTWKKGCELKFTQTDEPLLNELANYKSSIQSKNICIGSHFYLMVVRNYTWWKAMLIAFTSIKMNQSLCFGNSFNIFLPWRHWCSVCRRMGWRGGWAPALCHPAGRILRMLGKTIAERCSTNDRDWKCRRTLTQSRRENIFLRLEHD